MSDELARLRAENAMLWKRMAELKRQIARMKQRYNVVDMEAYRDRLRTKAS